MPTPMYNYGYYPQQNYMAQAQQTQPQQIQNGGLISVRSEMEARNYPIAPGNSITFKDENSPYVYTKTMGFSQLDRPTFEKFRLVKEEAVEASNLAQPQQPVNLSDYVKKSEFDLLRREFETFRKEIGNEQSIHESTTSITE